MFVVQRRDAATLMPLIMQHINQKTEIHSDEWRAYNRIKHEEYDHYTVNHTENFVDPGTGRHTQLIEYLWNVAKTEIDKRAMGKSESILEGYLAQQWFFSLVGKSARERFLKICEILKKRSYEQVKKDIKVFTNQMTALRETYSTKLKNIKKKTQEIKKKYFKKQAKRIIKKKIPKRL
jgi:hypothetical protein